MSDNPNPSYFTPEQDDVKQAGIIISDTSRFPVENVSWDDCHDFLKAMNAAAKVPAVMGKGKFALPHEDEWEYACRGGRGNEQPFYFGDQLNGRLANCDGDFPYGTDTKGEDKKRTERVGEYESLAPHPWGLCDMHGNVWQWCENLYENGGDRRVLRGGSWRSEAADARSASRGRGTPSLREKSFGFRVCFRPD
jgi:formylglycine-generating enzyme required for sulfatase activity